MLDFKQITAKDNRLVKLITLLQKSSKARKENRLFVLEGLRICLDAAENGVTFDTLVLSETAYLKFASDIAVLSDNAKSGVIMSDDLFGRISDTTTPQGVIALCGMPETGKPISTNGRYVALESVADPANIGAIARTAEALGIDGMIISGDSCDVYSPKALRASMGTLLRLPIYFCKDIISFLNDNSLRGYACIAQSDADLKIGEAAFSDGDVVIIGNEANGLLEETRRGAYKTVTVDMRGKAESLNASAAAAIVMWELIKR